MSIQSREMQVSQETGQQKNELMEIIKEDMRACGVDEDRAKDSQENDTNILPRLHKIKTKIEKKLYLNSSCPFP